MKISLIVARSKNGVIGKDNKLIWRLPNDLKYFKEYTIGKAVLMGRKTYESIGKPLPKRDNIILTRKGLDAPGEVTTINSLKELESMRDTYKEIVVIGGSNVYEQMMPYVDEVSITEIDEEFDGDAYFNCFNEDEWELVREEQGILDENNVYNHTFKIYKRKEGEC